MDSSTLMLMPSGAQWIVVQAVITQNDKNIRLVEKPHLMDIQTLNP